MSVEAATIPEDTFNSLNSFVGNLEKSLGKSLDPLNEVTKKMSSSKFGKNAKTFGKSMKGMAGASIQSWKMEQMMKLIEPFMKLLKLLEIPINTLSMLLTIMVNEIFIQLLPYFLEFNKLLIELIPIFALLGGVIGKVLVEALKWLYDTIVKIVTVMTPWIITLKEKFLPIWEKMKIFFEAFGQYLGRVFQPFWTAIKASFEILKKAWDDSGGKVFGKTGFVANAFRGLFDIVKLIANGVIGSINRLITEFNKIPGVAIGSIPLLANGGIVSGGPQLTVLGDNRSGTEAVVPLERAGDFGFGGNAETNSLLEEQNRLLQTLIRQNKEKGPWQI